jgi:hypothetical protein
MKNRGNWSEEKKTFEALFSLFPFPFTFSQIKVTQSSSPIQTGDIDTRHEAILYSIRNSTPHIYGTA